MGMWLMSGSQCAPEHTHTHPYTHIAVNWAQCNHNDKADCLNTQMGLPTALCVYVCVFVRVCVSVDNADWIADL